MFSLIALLLAGCSALRRPGPELPVKLRELIPADWKLTVDAKGKLRDIETVNIDGDEESEWIIFYHYDNSQDKKGPIGGIIYDAQQDTEPYNPDVIIPFPYQPSAFLVPYRLLPDWRHDKGQGYLADTRVEWEEARTNANLSRNDELVVRGIGPGGVTRLSIFWWQGVKEGYGVEHFKGSSRVAAQWEEVGERENAARWIKQVTTFNRLYERSNLCERVVYARQGRDPHDFVVTSPATIVFCQDTPKQPTYPEAVVLAWLLDRNPELVLPERLKDVENVLPESPRRVLSLIYTGESERSGTGNTAESRETVYTTVETEAGVATFWWRLIELRPKQVRETARWRIEGAGRQP